MPSQPKNEFRQNWHLQGFRIRETTCLFVKNTVINSYGKIL